MRYGHRAAWAFAATITAVASDAAFAQADFTGSGEMSELDCGGGTATITGADNQLRITGACTMVRIEGAGNRISVDMAPKSVICVIGASNEIRWTAPGQAKPRLSVTGAGNRISRGK